MTHQTEEFVLAEHIPGAAPARVRAPGPVRGRASTWALVGVALVIAGVLASPGPQYATLEDGIAWNVLDLDLTTEPTVTWTADVVVGEVLGELDGTVVVSNGSELIAEDAAAPAIVGLDAGTGAERWRIDEASCQLGAAAVTCVEDRSSPDARITVHTADGTSRSSVAYPGAMAALALDDGGMLVIEGGSTALAELVRLDARGREQWSSRMLFSGMADSSYSRLEVLADQVVMTSGGVFELATGGDPVQPEVVRTETAHDGASRLYLGDGSTLITLSEGTEFLVPPNEVWLEADDAFGGRVSLTWDTETEVVASWDQGSVTHSPPEGKTCYPFMRLQGTIVQNCFSDSGDPEDSRYVAVDQLTGELMWERVGGYFGPGVASTDTIVMTSGNRVEGIDPLTGESRWSITLPGDYASLSTVDGAVLVHTNEAIIRLD